MPYKQTHPKCSEADCPAQRYCKGLCKAHYRRLTGELTTPVKHYTRNKGARCMLVCDKRAYALGLCKAHYHRQRNGKLDWYAPLRGRRPTKGFPFGRVWVDGRYSDFFRKLADWRNMTPNQLASDLLEEYAKARLAGRLATDER